jgi:hypothetical protein
VSSITLPTSFPITKISWTLDRPAQVNPSLYSGSSIVVANPWHGKWTAHVDLAQIQGEANIRTTRAFFAQLRGQINTFQLPATEGSQVAGDATVSSGGAAGTNTVVLSGVPSGLVAGMLATVTLPSGKMQMVMLTQNISGSTITFEPPLRESAAGGAVVSLANPTCQVALTVSNFSWDVAPWRLYSFSFDVEERF